MKWCAISLSVGSGLGPLLHIKTNSIRERVKGQKRKGESLNCPRIKSSLNKVTPENFANNAI